MAVETYALNGAIEFPFPHRVRVAGLLTVEVQPGGVVPPTQYQVIGAGPNSTQVTVRWPNAPTDPTAQLRITRYTPAERVTVFQTGNVTPSALNAEFDNAYEALRDFTEQFGSWRGEWLTSTFYNPLEVVIGPDTNVYLSIAPHESDDFAADLAADRWRLLVDYETIFADAEAAADAAQGSAGQAQTSADEAALSAAEATSRLEDFRGQYYGPLTEDPTLDPNGDAPTAGDFYFNIPGQIWRVYDGTQWTTASTLVDLGTAATADRQTSTTDATAERLMLVGAFGVGLPSGDLPRPDGDSLNALRTSGFWRWSNATTGRPSLTGTEAGVCLHLRRLDADASGAHFQLAFPFEGPPLYRTMLDGAGAWSSWIRLADLASNNVFTGDNVFSGSNTFNNAPTIGNANFATGGHAVNISRLNSFAAGTGGAPRIQLNALDSQSVDRTKFVAPTAGTTFVILQLLNYETFSDAEFPRAPLIDDFSTSMPTDGSSTNLNYSEYFHSDIHMLAARCIVAGTITCHLEHRAPSGSTTVRVYRNHTLINSWNTNSSDWTVRQVNVSVTVGDVVRFVNFARPSGTNEWRNVRILSGTNTIAMV